MAAQGRDFEGVNRWRISAPKDRVIYDEGEPASAFYQIETGCVRLQVNREDGRRQILAFLLPGDIFGVQCDPTRRVAAEAVVRTDMTCFHASLSQAGAFGSGAAVGMASALCDLASGFATHVMGLCHASAESRVRWFLGWAAAQGSISTGDDRLELPMSRRDIADFLGLTPETLSRTFSRLEALGEVEVQSARRLVLRSKRRPVKRRDGRRLDAA
ncbi:cyclic nucleotide-binding domain-containing protein [Phenylobacterium sp.]|uniref:cyclic nucleotide-binding domain-containing protein n=1 Tax=Phenylobacterium sp. TaxID=1871053 RepID=UPI0035B0DFB9